MCRATPAAATSSAPSDTRRTMRSQRMKTDSNKDIRGSLIGYDVRLYFGTLRRIQAGAQPFQVRVTPGLDPKHQKFRGLVTVELLQSRFEGGQLFGRRLEQNHAVR